MVPAPVGIELVAIDPDDDHGLLLISSWRSRTSTDRNPTRWQRTSITWPSGERSVTTAR